MVTRRVRAMGIREKPIARGSPWQNCFAERLIGSIRRECHDHIVVAGEANLRILDSYATYYNVSRTHRSPGKDAPFSLADERAARRDWRGHFSAHAFAATASSLSPVASLAAMACSISSSARSSWSESRRSERRPNCARRNWRSRCRGRSFCTHCECSQRTRCRYDLRGSKTERCWCAAHNRGTPPFDLPVMLPTKYDFVINLKAVPAKRPALTERCRRMSTGVG